MALYQMQSGGALGSLLRKIQEEKELMPHRIPPSAEVVSPLRQMIAEPLKAPEAVGAAHVVGMKPEVSPVSPMGPGGIAPTPVGTPVPPVAPRIVAPVAPATPTPSAPSGFAAPAATPAPTPTPAPSVRGVSVQGPSLATQITPTNTPSSRYVPRLIVPGFAAPTPTPGAGTPYVPGKGYQKKSGGFYWPTNWGFA